MREIKKISSVNYTQHEGKCYIAIALQSENDERNLKSVTQTY